MTTSEQSASVKIYIGVIIALTIIVLFSSYARYIFAKDYYFLVESPCDINTQNCQIRDCDDYCPPNSLDVYQTHIIKAEYFEACDDNTCSNICEADSTEHLCIIVPCDEEETECSDYLNK